MKKKMQQVTGNPPGFRCEYSARTQALLSQLIPSVAEQAQGFEAKLVSTGEAKGEYIFRSSAIDQLLQSGKDWTIIEDSEKRVLVENFIEHHRLRQFATLTHSGRVDEEKISLGSTPSAEANILRCTRSRYFDSLLTNELVQKSFIDIATGEILLDGADLLFHGNNRGEVVLQSLEDSPMNNHIGISTLLLTADGYLALWRQASTAGVSAGTIVPSGSGSCEWKDLVPGSFCATIKIAMARELAEECGIPLNEMEDLAAATKITGFFRWLSRGGKPEFVGFTRTSLCLHELQPAQGEVEETVRLDQIRSIDELVRTSDQLLNHGLPLSLPLVVAASCLQTYCNNYPEEVAATLQN